MFEKIAWPKWLRRQAPEEGLVVRGFFRVQIADPEKGIVGDSGWRQNQVVNLGRQDYLCALLGNTTGSKQVTHMALGTGTAPGAAATSLAGEIPDAAGSREAVAVTINGSTQVQFTATFDSDNITAANTLQNIALFNTSAVTVGTLFAGNTYATSAFATNQQVQASYAINFSTS
jgi:hypothetical protein